MGIPAEVIKKTVSEFNGVEHRIQFVRELNGVKFYNDSKGTNPDAAIKAIEAMKGQTVLIGGGYDKKSTYDEWVELFPGKVRKLVLIGATADDIEKCARKHGFTDIARAATLKEAVKTALKRHLSSVQKALMRVMQFFYHLHVQAGICLRVSKKEELCL